MNLFKIFFKDRKQVEEQKEEYKEILKIRSLAGKRFFSFEPKKVRRKRLRKIIKRQKQINRK